MKKALCILLFLGCAILVSCRRQSEPVPNTSEPTTEYVIDAESLLEADEVARHDCSVHGHVFSKPTCQKVATCFYCGEQQGELAEHDWMHATCLRKAACTVCGAEKGDYSAHRFTTATCAAPSSCSVCGITTGSVLAHHFKAATCVSPSMCTVCMKKQGNALGHQWTGGTCTQGQVCTRCKRTLPAPGHKMTGGSCTEDSVCSVCGYTVKAKGHQYVDTVCTVCGKTSFEVQQEEATRTTTSVSTEAESTQPAPDTAKLKNYGEKIREEVKSAHDKADDAIAVSEEERRELALGAAENLRNAQSLISEAIAFCETDSRLKSIAEALNQVEKAIRESASITSFGDEVTINIATSIRSDCNKAMDAMAAYDKAIEKL